MHHCISIFFAQFQRNDTALKISTNFSNDIHFLQAFHLKFTINANIVYFPVEATFNTAIVCPNYYGQYFNENGISLYVYCVLTLIPAEQFNRTPFR